MAKPDVQNTIIKDSGKREEFISGMVRDTEEGKIRYDLALDGPMFDRYARHMTNGAKKYEPRNWMKAEGKEEYKRFKQSALRHFIQWFKGYTDEDHGSAVYFNINGAEYVKEKITKVQKDEEIKKEYEIIYFSDEEDKLKKLVGPEGKIYNYS